MRVFFPLPEVKRPVGGVNAALSFIKCLRNAGFDAAPLFASSHYVYPFYPDVGAAVFNRKLRLDRIDFGWKAAFRDLLEKRPASPFGSKVNKHVTLEPDDAVVLPEYCYPEVISEYEGSRIFLLAQDVFGFVRAFTRDINDGGRAIDRIEGVITTSEASARSVRQLYSGPIRSLKLQVAKDDLAFSEKKQKQIVLMPRKRAEEGEILKRILQSRLGSRDWSICTIRNLTEKQVVDAMHNALIFVSLSKQEGFGLPPAEAMLAGCIVVGYSGVGGNEYFSEKTGVPVADDDLIGLIEAIEETVDEYDRRSGRLDGLRRAASEYISERYNETNMRASVVEIFSEIRSGPVSKSEVFWSALGSERSNGISSGVSV